MGFLFSTVGQKIISKTISSHKELLLWCLGVKNIKMYSTLTIPLFFKGTVGPDYIGLRVEPFQRTWLSHQPLYVLIFLNFNPHFYELKVLSHLIQKLIPFLIFGRTLCMKIFFPVGLFEGEKSAKGVHKLSSQPLRTPSNIEWVWFEHFMRRFVGKEDGLR